MPEATRVVSALPAYTALSRYLMVLGASGGDSLQQHMLAEKFLDSPQVKATLEWRTKAAVAAGTTTDATWAGPLAPYGIAKELLTLLRGASILGQLENRFRRVPFRVKVARETGSGTGGAWVGHGLSTPVAATAYDTLSQEAYKAQKIVVLSNELLLLGNPDAERAVRDTVVAGVAAFLDAQLLTNTVTLSAGLRPAAITNNATAITSTGSTAAQINADLAAMLAAITTGGNGLVWIMRPLTAYKIAATIGGTAAVNIPQMLFGIPLILSENSPQQITLVDAAHILYSDTGGVDVDTSTEASIVFDDAPPDPDVAATVFRSLYQNNLWGLKVTRWIAYLRAQTGSVVYMTVAY
jgi:HK97 family phage major capsid protein